MRVRRQHSALVPHPRSVRVRRQHSALVPHPRSESAFLLVLKLCDMEHGDANITPYSLIPATKVFSSWPSEEEWRGTRRRQNNALFPHPRYESFFLLTLKTKMVWKTATPT